MEQLLDNIQIIGRGRLMSVIYNLCKENFISFVTQ
ncbi:hypothetical protein Indivirus_7_25 [Indivirus ILV1]|uniref:Uncharacterized protein n=1 Tax=Indivirus ILV1 TaxID=1977633 RepID=A0A1V0SE56_9VIRU|nr:hypothetical protein Indivirus_7_25 [Indivirus ILV1]